ncbi:MAG: FG-GAP repeat protein, partial [Armatimonadetes bacterium]|nr:FG-GAP repeat protein [Anaerolineae bacterium]
VIIGAAVDTIGTNFGQGSAYIFTRSNGIWTEQQKLFANDGAEYDSFGWSVALSGDGNTALIGVIGDSTGAIEYHGSAYIFTRAGTTWTKQQKLVVNGGEDFDIFGSAVDISQNGLMMVVGAPYDTVGINYQQGSAYIFALDAGNWVQQAHLLAPDGAAEDYFGDSVTLRNFGDGAIIGAPGVKVGGHDDQGAAYVFTRLVLSWDQEIQYLIADDGEIGDAFGGSVAIDGNGGQGLIGAPNNDSVSDTDQGAAYIIELPVRSLPPGN